MSCWLVAALVCACSQPAATTAPPAPPDVAPARALADAGVADGPTASAEAPDLELLDDAPLRHLGGRPPSESEDRFRQPSVVVFTSSLGYGWLPVYCWDRKHRAFGVLEACMNGLPASLTLAEPGGRQIGPLRRGKVDPCGEPDLPGFAAYVSMAGNRSSAAPGALAVWPPSSAGAVAPLADQPAPRALTEGGARFTGSADVDGDGASDWLVARHPKVNAKPSQHDLTVYFGPDFARAAEIATGFKPRPMATADVDGDNVREIIVLEQSQAGSPMVGASTHDGRFDAATGCDDG
jgi:hypothetical protein